MKAKAHVALPMALLGVLLAGSGAGEPPPAPAPASPSATGTGAPSPAPATTRREALGRAPAQTLPVLEGDTLEGYPVSTASLTGRRLVVFFFTPGNPEAEALAPALGAVVPLRAAHNFELLGVAVGSNPAAAARFAARHGLAFPILDDRGATMARRMGLGSAPAVIVADAAGEVLFARKRFPPSDPASARWLTATLRDTLRLPLGESASPHELTALPQAPDFERPVLGENRSLSLAALRGRGVVLVFFLHHCPHCQAALRTLQHEIEKLPEAKRPVLVGIETSGKPQAVRPALASAGVRDLPVVMDRDHGLRNAYGVLGQVPVAVMIDAVGSIVFRTKPGWDAVRDPDIVAMWLARAAGTPVPLRLASEGYSGSERCGACHPLEYATWSLTSHASAFDTLITHGAEDRAECVGCHVVGFGEPGGYALDQSHGVSHSDFEDVGCEACHGRGGPHRSPQPRSDEGYAPVCVECHDAKHSLGFDYARFAPRISHAAIASLDAAERQARYGSGRKRSPLPESGNFVGSEACRECHAAEFAIWSASPHARALESLKRAGRVRDEACLGCHTTGFGLPGGLARGEPPTAHPDRARVGCESCHGPGSAHVAEGARRRGSILALGDKCESCVILQICGGCHDDANDPGFAFEVPERIRRQRHGGSVAGGG